MFTSSPQSTPAISEAESPKDLPGNKSGGISSPSMSPLVSRNKRRLRELANSAQSPFASLDLGTPNKPEDESDTFTRRPREKRKMIRANTMPTFSFQPMDIQKTGQQSNFQSFGFKNSPKHKIRKLKNSFSPKILTSNSADISALSNSGERLVLPCQHGGKDAIKRISHETLADLISGKYEGIVGNYVVVDCRFHYEYEGGHIRNAINVNTHEELQQIFFSENNAYGNDNSESPALIFHCEFSSHRGPRMALHMRNHDRITNGTNYPRLNYPEIYVLDGGYKDFYYKHKELCEPQGYIEMKNTEFKHSLKFEKSRRGGSFMRQSLSFNLSSTKDKDIRDTILKTKNNTFISCGTRSTSPLEINEEDLEPIDDADMKNGDETEHRSDQKTAGNDLNVQQSTIVKESTNETRSKFVHKTSSWLIADLENSRKAGYNRVKSWSRRF